MGERDSAPRWKVVSAFAAVYVIWGSTYLAIRIAIETLPPFSMAALRFLAAGGALFLVARVRGIHGPRPEEWKGAALVGGLLLLGGNGAVVWAEQWLASGLAALLVATVPMWMVLVSWVWVGEARPGPWLVLGLVAGFVGVGLLVGFEGAVLEGRALLGGVVVLGGSVSWAVGAVIQPRLRMPPHAYMSTAAQMLTGGIWLALAALGAGEASTFSLADVSGRSWAALAYLVVFGALVAFSAFSWLLRVAPPAQVATYAYVNPVVALFLGWALADEPFTARTFVASSLILGAVVLITARTRSPAQAPEPVAGSLEPPGAST